MVNLITMGGYDKELEMNIVLSGHTIGYLEEAYIFDEKVANRAVFEHQCTRWIAAQWQFLTGCFRRGMADGLNGRTTGVLKIVQALVLPKVLLLGLLTACTALGLLMNSQIMPGGAVSGPVLYAAPLALLLTLGVSLLVSVPGCLWKQLTVRELFLIPVLMLSFARAMFNMRKAFKWFMHTPHTNTVPTAK